jgi:hypothetical protein
MIYKENDLVKYIGDYTTMEPIRRNEDFAKIFKIDKTESYWIVTLDLITSSTRIMCILSSIRPISTEEIHLIKLGFNEVSLDNGKKYFERDGVMLTSIAITFNQINFTFISGLCIGDLQNLSHIDIEKFLVDDKFNVEKFYSIYPSVQNINQLFAEIASKKWNFDIKSICS